MHILALEKNIEKYDASVGIEKSAGDQQKSNFSFTKTAYKHISYPVSSINCFPNIEKWVCACPNIIECEWLTDFINFNHREMKVKFCKVTLPNNWTAGCLFIYCNLTDKFPTSKLCWRKIAILYRENDKPILAICQKCKKS